MAATGTREEIFPMRPGMAPLRPKEAPRGFRSLVRFAPAIVDDGRIEIDNSAAERALRAVALGRKNYLFCGSDGGGESAAAIYTLLGSARLNDVDPERWLREVLSRIADPRSTASKISCHGISLCAQ